MRPNRRSARQRRLFSILLIGIVLFVLPGNLPVAAAASSGPISPLPMTSRPVKLDPSFEAPMTPRRSASVHLPPPVAGRGKTQPAPISPQSRETWTSHTHSVGNPSGSVTTQVFNQPTFRRVANGWVLIDATVRHSRLAGQPFSAEAAVRPIRFGSSANRILEFELDGGPVAISNTTLAIGVPQLSSNAVIYMNVAPDTDLRYTVTNGQVKEELVLKSANAPTSFTFHVADVKGQLGLPHTRPEGSTRFDLLIDSELTFELAAATAYEQPAAGALAKIESASAHMTVVKSGKGFDVTESVDRAWLLGKSFPIVLDPTVTINDSNGMYGSYSYYNPSNSCPGCTGQYTDGLGVGTYTDAQYNLEPLRSFFGFNLAAVPIQAAVSSATLTTNVFACMRYSGLCGSNSYTLEMHPMTSGAWGSTSTYSQLAAITDSSVFASLNQVSFTQNVGSTCYTTDSCSSFTETFTMTDQVQKWINGTAPNNGFAIKLQNEAYNIGGPAWCYQAAYCTGNPHPYLTIVYTSAPQAPQNVTASAGDQSANVAWVAPYTASPITSYSVQALNTSNQAVGSPVSACGTCLSVVVPGLANGLIYHFAVSAINAYGTSPATNSGTVTLPVPISVSVINPQPTYARGQFLTYSLTVSNPVGAATATVSSLSDSPLPAYAVQGTSVTRDGIACTPATTPACMVGGGAVSVSSFSLAGAESHTFSYSAVAIGNDRGCASVPDSAAATTAGSTTSHAGAAVVVCATGMGGESWRSYVQRNLGGGGSAEINVAAANLFVAQVDSTPIQARGQLSYSLLRSYNSQDPGLYTFAGNLASGWTLSVGGAGLNGADAGAAGLYIPPQHTIANPFAPTLIDRTGDRLVFAPRVPAFVPFDPTSASGFLGATNPKALVIDTAHYNHICVDTAFSPPPGVHLGMWRYLQVNSTAGSNWCSAPSTWTASAVLGFGAERPDRIRYEFSATGLLVSLADGNGIELRYLYDGSSRLTTVYEPRSCTNPATLTCRAFRFTYLSAEIDVADPAGRTTKYFLDTATPSHLAKVINPDSSQLLYTYGGCAGASSNQLCSATDPRGSSTNFTYSGATIGSPRVASVSDRLGHQTSLSYFSSPDYVTADLASERQRFQSIDSSGRVGEIDQGDTSDNYLHQSLYTWDVVGNTCRQPDQVVDNDLCKLVRKAQAVTPDETTTYLYNSEGKQLGAHRTNNVGPASVDTSAGYHAEYVEASGAVNQFDDSVSGSGVVSSQGTTRADANTLFAISDVSQALSPRGNAAGTGFVAYLISYKTDNKSTVNPNAALVSTVCANPALPTTNTGHVCEMDQPNYDASNPTLTKYTYDVFGQKFSMTTPKGGQYVYNYWLDTDLDISNNVSAGGWLKAVTDPSSNLAIFAYDRAGNVVRTWDRNATQGHPLTAAWNSQGSPPSATYTETLFGTYSSPWRFLTSRRDQLAGMTSYLNIDTNGNAHTIRPPRGNSANNSSFDVTQTFDNGDELLSTLMPAEASANRPTTYGYDVYGNRTSTTDPNLNLVVSLYDAANRLVGTKWTRGPWPADTTQVPAACSQSAAGDAPLPPGRIMCTTAITYDGVDNVLSTSDGNHQVTTYAYDGVHRQVRKDSPRNDSNFSTLRTDTLHDADGRVTDICPPREFTPQSTGTCTPTGTYSAHFSFDSMGRLSTSTTYHMPGGAANITTNNYDADGNRTQLTDANGHITTFAFDLLDRELSQTVPRDSTTSYTTSYSYDPSGNRTAVVKPGNLITAFGYDVANRLQDTVVGSDNLNAANAGAVDNVGGKNVRTRLVYDADGNIIARILPGAFTGWPAAIDYSYMVRTNFDADARPIARFEPRYDAAVPDPGLNATQVAQCTTAAAPAQPPAPPYPSGVGLCVTQLQYDFAGNTTKEILPTSSGSDNRFVTYSYTDDNLVSTVNSPNPAPAGGRVNSASNLYDGAGRRVKTTDANGIQQTTSYTSDGLTAQVVDQPNLSLSHTQSWIYDANGNKRTWTQYTGATWNYYYFSDNRSQYVYDPAGDKTAYTYDPVGNVTWVFTPSASAQDANNTAGVPNKNAYTYDNLLLTANVPTAPDGSLGRQLLYAYDGAARKISQTSNQINASGTVIHTAGAISYSYYQDDRLQTETGRPGGVPTGSITFKYDPAGSQTSVTDTTYNAPTGIDTSQAFYLDESVRTQSDYGGTSIFSYDGLGQPAARQDIDNGVTYTTSYTYSDAELPSAMTSNFIAGSTTWTYDSGGRSATQVDPTGTFVQWQWNPDDTMAHHNLQNATTQLADWTFTYDNNYHLTVASFTGHDASVNQTVFSKQFNYAYDLASRVSSYNNGSGALTATWDHDSNRLTYAGSSFSYNPDDSPRTSSTTFTYFGGVMADPCHNYTYDGFDRLQKVVSTGAAGCSSAYTMTYKYDGLDHQIYSAEPSAPTYGRQVHFDALSGTPSTESQTGLNASGRIDTLGFELDPRGQKHGIQTTTHTSNIQTVQILEDDGRGNLSSVTNTNQSVACVTFFDPWGSPMAPGTSTAPCYSGSTSNMYFYHGARVDPLTGNYQFGSRTYDPSKTSFLTPDSYREQPSSADLSIGNDPLTQNRYGYVNGDPVNLIDPTGHCAASDTACWNDVNSSDGTTHQVPGKDKPAGTTCNAACAAYYGNAAASAAKAAAAKRQQSCDWQCRLANGASALSGGFSQYEGASSGDVNRGIAGDLDSWWNNLTGMSPPALLSDIGMGPDMRNPLAKLDRAMGGSGSASGAYQNGQIVSTVGQLGLIFTPGGASDAGVMFAGRAAGFRDAVAAAIGHSPTDAIYQAHHVFPVQFGRTFAKQGIDVNQGQYGSWVEKSLHEGLSNEYAKDWTAFFRSGGGDAFDFARSLAGKYGFDVHF
jgi:RHS repeat-associated protein